MNTLDKAIFSLKGLVKRWLFRLKRFGFREYHHFPFDTNAPMPPGALAELGRILATCESFETGRIRMSDGTLLGFARDGALIPHDTDLDFDVFESPESLIRSLAKANNWTLGREMHYGGYVQQLTFYDSTNLIIDFVFWYQNGKFAINFSERGFMRVQPIEFFADNYVIDYGAVKGWVPSDLTGWLVYRYGENWNIPAKAKGDWKAECGDLIRFGSSRAK